MARTMQVLWTSAEGQVWDLTAPESSVQLVKLQLPGSPTFSQQFAVSGARDGRRYEGTTFNQTETIMTVSVGDVMPLPGRKTRRWGDEWRRELDRPWRRAISPERAGKLSIITGDTNRFLNLRLDQVYQIPGDQDPALIGEATYGHVLTADDVPWWQGEPDPAEFDRGPAPRPFFSGGTGANLYISSSNRLGKAELTNIGDREAYPKWFARGPFTSAVIGVGDQVVRLPFSREADQYVYVDSEKETITDENGNSLWPLMGFTDPTFAAVQPGESISLTTTFEGGDKNAVIGVSIVPLFEGPW